MLATAEMDDVTNEFRARVKAAKAQSRAANRRTVDESGVLQHIETF